MAAATRSRTHDHQDAATIFSRLDAMMGHLEEIKGSSTGSLPSTPVSDTGGNSSFLILSSSSSSPPKSTGYRPADEVLAETRNKGNLLNRFQQLEDHVLKLSSHLKEEVAEEGRRSHNHSPKDENRKLHGIKGFKSFVKSFVKTED